MREDFNTSVTQTSSAEIGEDTSGRIAADRARLHKQLAKQLRNFTALFAQVLVQEDDDGVHDLRVCTRRLQQVIAALVPEQNLKKARSVRRTLRRVRRSLGPWRNCDVALQRVATIERRASNPTRKAGWSLVRESISAERRDAIGRARRRLYKAGGIMLTHRVQQLLSLPEERLGSLSPGDAVRAALGQAADRWHQALGHAQADRELQSIHALRIATKRLRYRLELARDLGAGETPTLIQWLKGLQDRLGRWHDRQELSRFIARALANSEVMIRQPRIAVELLKEVERNRKLSSRELDELFALMVESEGLRALDGWLRSYCTPPEAPVGAPVDAGPPPASESIDNSAAAAERRQAEAESDEKAQS